MWKHLHFWWWRGGDVCWQLTSASSSTLGPANELLCPQEASFARSEKLFILLSRLVKSFLKRNCQSRLIALSYVWQIGTEVLLAPGWNESCKSELLYWDCSGGYKPHSSVTYQSSAASWGNQKIGKLFPHFFWSFFTETPSFFWLCYMAFICRNNKAFA